MKIYPVLTHISCSKTDSECGGVKNFVATLKSTDNECSTDIECTDIEYGY